jgi:hypothetical protein
MFGSYPGSLPVKLSTGSLMSIVCAKTDFDTPMLSASPIATIHRVKNFHRCMSLSSQSIFD